MDSATWIRRWEVFRRARAKKWYKPVKDALDDQVKQFLGRRMLTDITGAKLADVLTKMYTDVGVSWANETRLALRNEKRMPMGFSAQIIELMFQYFGTDFLNMAEGMTQTTRDIIAEILTQAQIGGEDFNWVSDRITAVLFNAVRARLIARTETVAAANQAAIIQADTYDFYVDKVWLSVQDRRTRDGVEPGEKDHLHMNGITVPQGQPFNVSGELMMHPGDKGGRDGRLPVSAANVCNCRCTTAFIPRRDANGRLVRKNPV